MGIKTNDSRAVTAAAQGTTFRYALVSVLGAFMVACGPAEPGSESGVQGNRDPIIHGDPLPSPETSGVVLLGIVNADGSVANATGVLLDNSWVLTAGHPFEHQRPRSVTLHVGGFTNGGSDPVANNQERDSAQVIFHPLGRRVDVALVRADEPFEVLGSTSGYRASIFEEDPQQLVGQTCWSYGYGESQFDRSGVGELRYGLFDIISLDSPSERAGDPNPLSVYFRIRRGSSTVNNPTLPAPGDSGGPCFIFADGKLSIAGVLNTTRFRNKQGQVTGVHEWLSHYTRGDAFAAWARRTISDAGMTDVSGDAKPDMVWQHVTAGSVVSFTKNPGRHTPES